MFFWIAFDIAHQIFAHQQFKEGISWYWEHLTILKCLLLVLVVALMFLQLFIEALKFQLLINADAFISFGMAVKSVFGGMALANSSPNRIAEFAGRVIHLPSGVRTNGVLYTFISGFAQLIITLFVGMFSLYVFKPISTHTIDFKLFMEGMGTLKFIVPTLCLFVILVYFTFSVYLFRIISFFKWNKIENYLNALKQLSYKKKVNVLLLSLCRFIIFQFQYYFLFLMFDVSVGMGASIAATSIMFLFIAFIPTISYLELGLRWKLSLFLLGGQTQNVFGIIAVITFIWFINFVLPALIGSFTFVRPKESFSLTKLIKKIS